VRNEESEKESRIRVAILIFLDLATLSRISVGEERGREKVRKTRK